MSGIRAQVDSWARLLKRKVTVLSLAIRHPRTPLLAKVVGGLTVAYAVSPIDLIPDFIPVLGYLDDILLVPLGVYLFMKLVPADVWAECEERATAQGLGKLPKDPRAVVLIIVLWVVGAWMTFKCMRPLLYPDS